MTIATTDRMTLEAFLAYEDGQETRYELVDGVLVDMGTESTINTAIVSLLFAAFLKVGLPFQRLGIKQKLEVRWLALRWLAPRWLALRAITPH